MRDLFAHEGGNLLSALSFSLVPYLSLIVHESARKLRHVDPAALALLSPEVAAISARSRHSLKLFEDTKCGIDGQLGYFRDEILPPHSERFLNNTWLWLARRLEADLGLYCYGGRLITTTHAATFHPGIEPKKLIAEGAGPYTKATFEEYGQYFGALGARLDSSGEDTFIKHLNAAELDDPSDVSQ
ncbi:hypothetical protein [Streptomyces sp. NPDC048106]|uniref:hypothetical protein n=1 Tax=Streptomyces sp. NPDC048106 TaxID=3155750 RepID=UPI0034556759